MSEELAADGAGGATHSRSTIVGKTIFKSQQEILFYLLNDLVNENEMSHFRMIYKNFPVVI